MSAAQEPSASLTADEAMALRMRALLLAGHGFTTPGQVVEWFGAMQAQDVASGHWSFGVRLPGLTEADVTRATEDRQIVRTWPMRGTIHFVPPADARWMLEVTGARQLRGLGPRWGRLGIDETMVRRASEVLAEVLAGGRVLTRAQCLEALTEAGLEPVGQRGYHYLWWSSQVGVTVIGPQRGKEQTFALLDDWVPQSREVERVEGLTILAERYLRSHGPATLKDFAGWIGMPMSDARAGVVALGDRVVTVDVGGVPMLALAASLAERSALDSHPLLDSHRVVVLPGFDEYLLGFKDRALMAESATMAAVIPGGNGIFRNTIVVGGRVRATWTRSVRATRVAVEVLTLGGWRPTRAQQDGVAARFDGFAAFLGLPDATVSYR